MLRSSEKDLAKSMFTGSTRSRRWKAREQILRLTDEDVPLSELKVRVGSRRSGRRGVIGEVNSNGSEFRLVLVVQITVEAR